MGSSISDLDGACEADHNACVAHDELLPIVMNMMLVMMNLIFVVDVIVLGHPRMDVYWKQRMGMHQK